MLLEPVLDEAQELLLILAGEVVSEVALQAMAPVLGLGTGGGTDLLQWADIEVFSHRTS
jgi:hypothetical protein